MRDKFLNQIRQSLRRALLPDAFPDHPGSFQSSRFPEAATRSELVAAFTRELELLAGHAHPVNSLETAGETVLEILGGHQARKVMAWDGSEGSVLAPVRATLARAGISVVPYSLATDTAERRVQLADLDGIIVGITGAHGGLADSGAIALTSGKGQGRLPSLLPPVHIAILSRQKILPSLPAFLATYPEVATAGSNLVFVAGPSRTGDIEMTLTMGVHGPGEVHVILTP